MKKLTLISLAVLISASCVLAGWWRTFGGAESDEGTCVQQTTDGGYIITGVTWSVGDVGNANIWLIKLDSLGHKEWDKTYGLGGGYSVRQTSDGGYIISGSKLICTDENGDTLWTRDYGGKGYCIQTANDGNYIITGIKSNALWLIKIDDNGNNLWERTYQKGNYEDIGNYVEQTSDGGFIVVGLFGVVDEEYGYKSSLWLLKMDTNGDTMWTRTYGGERWELDYDRGRCVRQASDGGYIVAGPFHVVDQRYNLLKTDDQGNMGWAKLPYGGEFRCVEELPGGGYIVTGGTEWGTLTSSVAGGNLWLIKTDENGDTVWTREYGAEGTDAGRYVQQTSDSGYIITGYTWSYGEGREDLYLLKTDSLGLLGIYEDLEPEVSKTWQVATFIGDQITLRYWNKPHGFKADLFDATGRKVDELYSSQTQGIITWGQGYPPGVYFIQTNETKRTSTAKVVLVH